MKADYDVAIIGAGLIGSAFALLLSQRTDLRIALIERGKMLAEPNTANQRVVALGSVATKLLDDVGVFSKLDRAHAYPYGKMTVWDDNTDAQLEFDAQEFGRGELGHMVDSVECNRLLQMELKQRSTVDLLFEFSPESLSFGDSTGQIKSNTQTLSARLIVAADGGRSWARQQAKIFSHRFHYEQTGIVAKVTSDKPHQDTAWQRFLGTGPLAFLPLADNQSSIVWSATSDFAEQLLQMPKAQFESSLTDAFDARLGKVELLSERLAFPLSSQRADQYHKANFVLIGDAAHSIHPLAGQGANLGFKDVLSLVSLLEGQAPEAIADVALLKKYQRLRKADNEQTDWLMGMLHHAYQNDNPWWLVARARGVMALAGSRSMREMLVKHAIGDV